MRHPVVFICLGLSFLVLGCEGSLVDRLSPVTPPAPPTPPSLAFRIGDIGADVITAAVSDPGGNVSVAGTFTGTVDFDPGVGVSSLTSLGATDVFVAQYTPAGTLVWVSRLGGTGNDRVTALTRDPSGNLLVAGAFEGATDVDPGAGVQILTSLGGEDGYLVKLSPLGNLVWSRRFGGPNADAIAGVATDAAGRVYVAGTFSGTANMLPAPGASLTSNGSAPDGFVLSLDAGGVLGFAFPIGGPDTDAANAIAVSGGAVVVGGSFRGTATFLSVAPLPVQVNSLGSGDGFLAGYTTAGTLLWARGIGGPGDEEVSAGGLAADLEGGVVATGTFTLTADFDPGPGTTSRTSLGATDWFAARYDAAGAYRSVFAIGSVAADLAPSPAVDAEGNLLLTGAFGGPLDFDPGPGSNILSSFGSAGATDAFVARYTMAGALLWVSRFGEATSVAERTNRGRAVVAFPLGGVLVAGQFFGIPDFDPGSNAFRMTSLGSADGFVVLLTSSGALALAP